MPAEPTQMPEPAKEPGFNINRFGMLCVVVAFGFMVFGVLQEGRITWDTGFMSLVLICLLVQFMCGERERRQRRGPPAPG